MPGKYRLLDSDFEEITMTKDNSFKGGLYFNAGVSLRVKEKSN
ncbi:MAG TPA: hypothetical protein VKY36_04830 [Moheibacter sp.]|nr:hypothetical protein [Moheibacter sp.]